MFLNACLPLNAELQVNEEANAIPTLKSLAWKTKQKKTHLKCGGVNTVWTAYFTFFFKKKYFVFFLFFKINFIFVYI